MITYSRIEQNDCDECIGCENYKQYQCGTRNTGEVNLVFCCSVNKCPYGKDTDAED